MKIIVDIICELLKKIKYNFEFWLKIDDGYKLLQVEELILRIFQKVSGKVMGELLKGLCNNKELESKAIELALKKRPWLKIARYENVNIKLLSGLTVKVRTLYMCVDRKKCPGRKKKKRVRGKGGSGCYPVLSMLGINHRATPGLISEISRQVILQSSMEMARKELSRRGIELDIKIIHNLSLYFGQEAIEYREKLIKNYGNKSLESGNILRGKIVVLCLDGGRVQVRTGGKRGLRGKSGRRKFKPKWKEPKLLRIYVIDSNGHKISREIDFIDGTMGDSDELMKLVYTYLTVFGIEEAEKLIVIADGAPWIWNRIKELRTQFKFPKEKVIEILDFYHGVEYLSSVMEECKNWSEGKKKRWLNRQRKRLKEGHFKKLIKKIKKLGKGKRAKAIRKVIEYFQEHRERMRYSDFKKAGYPIGSGAIESAVRRVVNLRMKGPGMFWLPESAEAFLHIRAQLLSGRWDNLCKQSFSEDEHQFEDLYFQEEETNIVSLEDWKKQRIKANEINDRERAA